MVKQSYYVIRTTGYWGWYLLPDLEYARLPVPLMVHTSLSAREPETNWKRLRKLLRRGWKKGKLVSSRFRCNFPSSLCSIAFSAKFTSSFGFTKNCIKREICARKRIQNLKMSKVPYIISAHCMSSVMRIWQSFSFCYLPKRVILRYQYFIVGAIHFFLR